mgnify:CR=1 FL=1
MTKARQRKKARRRHRDLIQERCKREAVRHLERVVEAARVEKMCGSKRRFPDEEHARGAAIDARQSYYRCPLDGCGGFHLTSRQSPRGRVHA